MPRLRPRPRRPSLLSAYSADMGQLVSRRRAERALRAAALESAAASRAKTEFLANMSHELRTPLNAIIGFGDLLQQLQDDELQSESTKEYAAHIARAGRHLLGIIGDILDISKIEAGKFKPATLAQVIMNIVSLTLFPALAAPVLQTMGDMKEVHYIQLIESRQKHIAEWVLHTLR